MADETIVVLGCGVAGLATARELRRRLPRNRILVIDRSATATYPPSYASMAVGEVRAGAIRRPRERLARLGIEFVNAPIQVIDMEARQVRAESRVVRYDCLVIALGAVSTPQAVPGLAESAQTFQTFEGAERLGAALRYFAGGRVLVAVSPGPNRWPPAAYELAMLIEHHFHERKMRQKVEVAIATPESAPLEAFGSEVSELLAGQLAHKGIEFLSGASLEAVDHARRVARLTGGDERPFDLLISAPPLRCPDVVVESGLADETGWVVVEGPTMQARWEGMFAVGDIARRAGAKADVPGLSAGAQAATVASEIASRLGAVGERPRARGKGRFFVEVGAGAAFMVSGDFLARPDRLAVTQPSIVWHWAKAAMEKRWRYERW